MFAAWLASSAAAMRAWSAAVTAGAALAVVVSAVASMPIKVKLSERPQDEIVTALAETGYVPGDLGGRWRLTIWTTAAAARCLYLHDGGDAAPPGRHDPRRRIWVRYSPRAGDGEATGVGAVVQRRHPARPRACPSGGGRPSPTGLLLPPIGRPSWSGTICPAWRRCGRTPKRCADGR